MWRTRAGASTRASVILVAALLSGCGWGHAALRGEDGRLASCAARNCVTSLSTNPVHAIAPLTYTGTPEAARAQLVATLRRLPRTDVISAGDDYVYATSTTPVMRYVDDLEFVFASPGVIQLRSASRVGTYDFGVNRERIELIRAMFSGGR